MLGGHIRAVFTLVTFIFIICVSVTLVSFREIPLRLLQTDSVYKRNSTEISEEEVRTSNDKPSPLTTYGAVSNDDPDQNVMYYNRTSQNNDAYSFSYEKVVPIFSKKSFLKIYHKIFFMKNYFRGRFCEFRF